jgi:hypothetical protein
VASVSLSFPDLILLTVTLTAAVVAVRILWSLASSRHRAAYGRPVKYVFVMGALLGLLLPWNEWAGLTGALMASLVLLLLSSAYSLLGWRTSGSRSLALVWIPRETMRDWFLYLSVGAGVIGVVTTVISLVVSPLLGISLSSLVPLAFDTVSILSALLEFTVYVPSYNNIFALVYTFITHVRRVAPDSGEPYLDDLDFKRITEGSHFTDFEVRDAMESLVRRGFASKISPVPVARIVFKIGPYGIRFLKSVWEEVFFSMEREKAQIEARMLYLREKLRYAPAMDRELQRRVRDELQEFRRGIDELGEYGVLLGEAGRSNLFDRLADLEEIVAASKDGDAKEGS